MSHAHSVQAGTVTIVQGTATDPTTETLSAFCRCGAYLESTRRHGEDWSPVEAVLERCAGA